MQNVEGHAISASWWDDIHAAQNRNIRKSKYIYEDTEFRIHYLVEKRKTFKMFRGQTNNCLQHTQQHRLVLAVQLCAFRRASNMQHRFCPCYPRSVLQLVCQAIAFLGRTWLVAKVCRSVTLFPPTRRPVRPVAEFKNFVVRGTAGLPSSPPPPPRPTSLPNISHPLPNPHPCPSSHSNIDFHVSDAFYFCWVICSFSFRSLSILKRYRTTKQQRFPWNLEDNKIPDGKMNRSRETGILTGTTEEKT